VARLDPAESTVATAAVMAYTPSPWRLYDQRSPGFRRLFLLRDQRLRDLGAQQRVGAEGWYDVRDRPAPGGSDHLALPRDPRQRRVPRGRRDRGVEMSAASAPRELALAGLLLVLACLCGCQAAYTSIRQVDVTHYVVTRTKIGPFNTFGTVYHCTATSDLSMQCVEIDRL
jgi:hypothetical protein